MHAHPCPDSYSTALRERTVTALRRRGHAVRVADLHAERFDPVLTLAEHRHHLDSPATKPQLAAEFERLQWAQGIVLVYPTWWGGQPALLKGWFDRVWASGVAFDLPPGATRIRPRLTDVRRLAAVTTHGSSKWVNVLEGEPGKVTVQRSLRLLCRRTTRFQWIALYGLDRSGVTERERFLHRVEQSFRRW